MRTSAVKALLVEDNIVDVIVFNDLIKDEAHPGIHVHEAQSLALAFEAIETHGVFDVILLDLNLPDSNGFDTFKRVFERSPAVPIIVMTGLDDSELALKTLAEGAQDYLVKGEFDGRLCIRTIKYAIERNKLLIQLQAVRLELATLSGLLPICSNCKKVRNDKGYWESVEQHISDHSEVIFSHGICPECLEKLYPEEDGN